MTLRDGLSFVVPHQSFATIRTGCSAPPCSPRSWSRGSSSKPVSTARAVIGALGLLVCVPQLAQSQTVVPSNAALLASFSYPTGTTAQGFRPRVDGKPLPDIAAELLAGGQVTFPVPAQAEGSHSLVVCAFNVAGESCSAPLAFTATGLPPAPTNLTITAQSAQVKALPDGTIQIVAVNARVVP